MKFLTLSAAVLMVIPGPCLKADVIAYESNGANQFGTMDLTTGVFSLLGNSGQLLSGLGTVGGVLYGGLDHSSTVEHVNTANGAITPISTSGATPTGGWYDFGSTLTNLYGIDQSGVLYSINPSTGVVTSLGSTGLSVVGITIGLSTGSSSLYFTDGSSLFTLNTTNGTPTPVGSNSGDTFGALLFAGSTLYAGENTPSLSVATLNTSTGAATSGPSVTGTTSPFWGLAQVQSSATPEPGSFLLAGMALAGLLAARRKRNV
jgi:MYXO-CTERM domain-containing protein